MRALNTLPCVTKLTLRDNTAWHPNSLVWLFDVAAPNPTLDPSPLPSLMTTITDLTLTGSNQFATVEALSSISKLRNLRTFEFLNVPLQPETTRALLDSIPNIEFLNLNGCKGITEQGAMYLLTCLPRLVHIDITGCRGVTDKVLLRLITGLTPSIKRLHIGGLPDGGGTGKLSDFSLSSFTNCKVKLEVSWGSREFRFLEFLFFVIIPGFCIHWPFVQQFTRFTADFVVASWSETVFPGLLCGVCFV